MYVLQRQLPRLRHFRLASRPDRHQSPRPLPLLSGERHIRDLRMPTSERGSCLGKSQRHNVPEALLASLVCFPERTRRYRDYIRHRCYFQLFFFAIISAFFSYYLNPSHIPCIYSSMQLMNTAKNNYNSLSDTLTYVKYRDLNQHCTVEPRN